MDVAMRENERLDPADTGIERVADRARLSDGQDALPILQPGSIQHGIAAGLHFRTDRDSAPGGTAGTRCSVRCQDGAADARAVAAQTLGSVQVGAVDMPV